MVKEEKEGSTIKINLENLEAMLKIEHLLGSETKFLLSIGSIKESINPYFMHIWINKENLIKFKEQIETALLIYEETNTALKNLE